MILPVQRSGIVDGQENLAGMMQPKVDHGMMRTWRDDHETTCFVQMGFGETNRNPPGKNNRFMQGS